jgi:hypothetical protein
MREHGLVHVPALHFPHGFDLFAVLLGFVMLLAVLVEAMMSLDGRALGAPDASRALALVLLNGLEETPVRSFTVLPLGVLLRPWLALLPVPHESALLETFTALVPATRRVGSTVSRRAQARGQRLPPAMEVG